MKNITTSLYAVAHVTNPEFMGSLTDKKEYPVFKILENNRGRRIVIVNDDGQLQDWSACFFTFVTK